jgi:FlaA1/EpsC-like NDP-sugar epimerase
VRNRYLLLLDVPLLALCVFLAFGLRFDLAFIRNAALRELFLWHVTAAIVLKPLIFLAFGMYGRYWRYASIGDLLAIALSVSASTFALSLFLVCAMLLQRVEGVSRSVLLIDWLLTLVVVGGLRLSVRVTAEARQRGGKRGGEGSRRVVLVGAGEAGTMVAREIRRNPQLRMDLVGYLDDDPTKLGKRIAGLPVLGNLAGLHDLLVDRGIDEVIIAMPTAPGTVVRKIAERCREVGIPSRTMPGVFELLDGVVSVNRLRQIDITDLLRRSAVSTHEASDRYLSGRVVLVTGAGGSIGTELCRQVARAAPRRLILLGHGENSIFDAEVDLRRSFPALPIQPVIADIRDERRMDDVFRQYHPGAVFHAAAHKHVPLMEDNPEEALSNNVLGTAALVRAALAHGTDRFVLISTDKAVAPTSIMGASKRLAEAVVREAASQSGRPFVAVRFGNVLGSRGSVVPLFKRQIEMGLPITITHPEMRRFFMTIPEAVHLVLQAGGLGKGGELFVLNMGEPVRIVDLAQDVITLSGFSLEEIPIVYTGIRPGEKLTEALWESDAEVKATAHPEILEVLERQTPLDLERMLIELTDVTLQRDRDAIEAALVRWVDTFAPPPDAAYRHAAPLTAGPR